MPTCLRNASAADASCVLVMSLDRRPCDKIFMLDICALVVGDHANIGQVL